jgi:anti-sigma factor RsiW
MSDIVERLRRTLSDLPGNDDDLFNEIHAQRDEAANEIERLLAREARLREALEKIAHHDMQAIAMDALQPGERIRPPAPGVSND